MLGCCNTRPIFGKSSHTLIARLSCGDLVDFVCLYSEYSHAIFGEDYPAKVLVFMVHDDEIMRKYSLAYFGRFRSYLGEHPLLFGDFKLVKQDEFSADHHRELLGERELNTRIWVCVLGIYIYSCEVFSQVLRHLEFECE